MRFVRRWIVLAAMALLLGACGFRLAREVVLPGDMRQLQVQTPDAFGVLQTELERALSRSGAVLDGGAGSATLLVSQAELTTRPLSIGPDGRVQEFALVYQVSFSLLDAQGQSRISEESLELQRDYRFDAGQTLGSPAEEALVREELERQMAAAVMRRLDAYFRGG
ncbi:MAG: hypothetical protein KDJ14_07290 [Xanthomonadales bacterium]|nr:hypothetical protein [Xanthomonadales bacterium]